MNDPTLRSLVRKRDALKVEFAIQENCLLNFQVNSFQDHFELSSRLEQVHLIHDQFSEVLSQLETSESDTFENQEFERRHVKLVTHCQSLLQGSRFNPDCNVPWLAIGSPSLPPPHEEQSTNQGVPNFANKSTQLESYSAKSKCLYCNRNHPIFTCRQFLNLSTTNRNEHANSHNLCPNCLCKNVPNHKCSTRTCRHCSESHHMSLHVDSPITNKQWTQQKCCMNRTDNFICKQNV